MNYFKKNHPFTFEAALYCLLFAAALIYIETGIKPRVLYYWNPALFLTTFDFFRDIALLPGGLTTYADKFLFQLNAFPWLGSLAIVTISFLTGLFSSRIFTTITRLRFSFFIVVPLFLTLCTLNQFRIIPLTKLLFALVFADIFFHVPVKKAMFRVVVFFIASLLYIGIVHDLFWFFTALCMIFEILRREDRWGSAVYSVLTFAILFIDYRYFSYLTHTKVESPLAALAGSISHGSVIEAILLAILVMLAATLAYKKRAISALVLVAVFIVGFVDLQTWLSSSKALFCLLLGAPLSVELFSSMHMPEQIRKHVWLRTGAIAFLSLIGVSIISLTVNEYWGAVLRLNYYSAVRKWSSVLLEVQKPPLAQASPMLVSPFIFEALHHTGRLPDDLFKYGQLYPPFIANVTVETTREDLEAGKYMVNLQQNARVCFELGLINYAELMAYDVLEYREDLLSSYQLIALIYLLKGNCDAARHFLTAIKNNLLSSSWADKYLAYVNDPKRMEGDDYLMSIKSRMLSTDDPVDSLLGRPPFFEIAHRLAAHDPRNTMAREYLMSSYLINGQLTKLYKTFFQGDSSDRQLEAPAMPRVCEEAALMYLAATGLDSPPSVARRIHQTTYNDFMEHSNILQKRATGYPVNTVAYKRKFGASYFYYYTSLMQRQP